MSFLKIILLSSLVFEYADYIYHLNEKDRAIKIYEDIYFNTDNLDLASRAAMALAKDYLSNHNAFKARNLRIRF